MISKQLNNSIIQRLIVPCILFFAGSSAFSQDGVFFTDSMICYDYKNANDSTLKFRFIYQYDSKENLVSNSFYYRNVTEGKWIAVYKADLSYNTNENKTIYHYSFWDSKTNNWGPFEEFEQIKVPGAENYLPDYSYDTDPNTQLQVKTYKFEYRSDVAGNKFLDKIYKWDPAQNKFLLIEKYYTHRAGYLIKEFKAICEGDSYLWQGKAYTEKGTFRKHFYSVSGRDSILQLNLLVDPAPRNFDILGDKLVDMYQTTTYTAPLNPEVNYSWSANNAIDIVSPENNIVEIIWGSEGTGEIFAIAENQKKCKSDTSFLEVSISKVGNVEEPYRMFRSDTICMGDILIWEGNILTKEGYYAKKYHTASGRDSILQLRLFVEPLPQDFNIQGDIWTYEYQSVTYRAPLNPEVNYSWSANNALDIVSTENNIVQITWGSEGTGEIFAVAENQNKCKSDTSSLEVIISEVDTDDMETYLKIVNDTICIGDSLTWEGNILKTTGIYSKLYHTADGRDSILQLKLYVEPLPQDFYIEGDTWVYENQSVIYSVPENHSVNYSWSASNSVALVNSEDNIVLITWGSEGTGEIYAVAENHNNCKSEVSLLEVVIIKADTADTELNNGQITVYPNPVRDFLTIDSQIPNLRYNIVDINGKVISSGVTSVIMAKIDFSNYPSGIYFLLIDGKDVYRIVKEKGISYQEYY